MKHLLTAIIFTFLVCAQAHSQEKPQYAASLIPDSLKQNANSVIREQTETLVIKKPGKGRQEIKRVITVLNEKGEEGMLFVEFPDKFRKIDDIDINLYDANGKYIRQYKRKDLEKVAGDDGFSLVTDNKILYGYIRTDKYPVTIEYNYAIVYEGFLEYDDFYPQTVDQSIQQSVYSITTDKSNNIRYKNYRCDLKPAIREEGNSITYTWSVKNVQPYQKERGSARRDVPRVLIAPTLFEMDDYDGDMSSWDSYGKWQITLINQTNKLPADRVAYYQNLVKDAKSEREKVQILYKHLQENYRYVSIQLGIGGWKPFTADFVEKKKYGDCKALSNFMYAMLNAVNIRSHYAVINAGSDEMPVDKDFPQTAFNHVILCVPLASDTVWLECTDRTQPFGELGNFTENRNALLITEKGGVMVATPRSKPEQNLYQSYSFIDFAEDGSGKASVDIQTRGEFTSKFRNYVLNADDQRKKSFLINTIGFKQPDAMELTQKINNTDISTLHLSMQIEKVPDFSAGPKHFLNSRIYKFWDKALPKSEKRQNDYYLEFPFVQSDSTVYQLPEGYKPENIPKAATINSEMGSFQSNYYFDEAKRQLITTCSIRINKHVIPAARYQETLVFFSDVIKF